MLAGSELVEGGLDLPPLGVPRKQFVGGYGGGVHDGETLTIIDDELPPLLELYGEVLMGMPVRDHDINRPGGLATRSANHGDRD